MEVKEQNRLTVGQKRVLKLALDAVMLILLVLMYKKQVISMSFHEIGGLALIGLYVIHHIINARWIGASTKRLFSKGTSGLVRARYIVDVLLLVAFLTVGITGILISEVVFSFHVMGNYKVLHYFAAAAAVLLMGVHLGLHADYIFGKILRKGANRIAKIVLAAVIAVMIAFGGYSLFTTSFLSYLTAPLQSAQMSHGEFLPSGDIALDGSNGSLPSDLSELPEFSGTDSAAPQSGDGNMQAPQGMEGDAQFPQDAAQAPQDAGSDHFGGGSGMGQGEGFNHTEGNGGGNSTSALMLIAQYVSIITLFAAITYGILKLTCKRRTPVKETVIVVEEAAQITDGDA